LSQAAPILPLHAKEPAKGYGVTQPVSSANFPSIYNKKLNKLFRGRLVVLSGDFTVAEALRRMSRYNISSVPVTKSESDSTILGFVDMLDMLAYLCSLIGYQEGQKIDKESSQLKEQTDRFKNTRIAELVDMSGRNPFSTVHGEESLCDAVEIHLKGCRRIAITDDSGEITGVVSQWTIVNYLATVQTDEKNYIPSLKAKVAEYGLTEAVKTVHISQNTLESFVKMYNERVSALGVVDDDGRLVGNLSASDLKGFQLYLNDFGDLLQPVGDFLNLVRQRQARPDNFVVAVARETKVIDVVKKLNQEIVHRAYVVDKDFKPVGIFSLTDLMQKLISDTHTTVFSPPTQQTAFTSQ